MAGAVSLIRSDSLADAAPGAAKAFSTLLLDSRALRRSIAIATVKAPAHCSTGEAFLLEK